MNEWIFRLGFSTLLAHEFDAVARSEWRVLPLTSFLPDDLGYLAFVMLHIPLVAWLIHLTGHSDATVRLRWQGIVSVFLVIHVGLHLLFVGHEHYDFHSALSRSLIFGAGAFGALHLILRRYAPAKRTGARA